MTLAQREWARQQPWFDYLVESRVVFTKCGKRFDNFDALWEWSHAN